MHSTDKSCRSKGYLYDKLVWACYQEPGAGITMKTSLGQRRIVAKVLYVIVCVVLVSKYCDNVFSRLCDGSE